MHTSLLNRIIIDPEKFDGQPYLHRTHFTVPAILRMLADGMDQEEILSLYPPLTPLDIRATLAFAAQRIEQDDALSPAMMEQRAFSD